MKAVSRTHIGNVRSSNQDALVLQSGTYGVFGVADGMGGHKAGDVASQMAAQVIKETLADAKPSADLLRSGIEEANRRIYMEQLENPDYNGMGTTVTVIWEDESRLLLGHVGDSRCYRLRGETLDQLSMDHSMVAELVREGLLTPEEAAHHPYRNIITRAVGTGDTIEVDVMDLSKLKGDKYLLCSDGLYEYLPESEIQELLSTLSLEEAADTMLALALERGGKDNISLVLTEVDA
ncbi:MAG: Stp1/IreP family PP2C-type Ser/Thr phosphatase [Clostridia bacterium]|nr:Stp1/IreP family PP2C-type Ser/Thr phosphatase [Clostridia bacterium]